MPYKVNKALPTRAVGMCPICKRENQILHVVAFEVFGELVVEYVCAWCLVDVDERTADKGKALENNPKVEVNENAGQ